MKGQRRNIFFILSLLVWSVAIAGPDEFEVIAAAIRIGDAHNIAMHFDKNVDIKTDDKSVTYSKNQAELVLSEFFQHNVPKSFTIIHKGSSAKGAKYFIGTLETSQGVYRSFVYVKEMNGKELIEEMSFEKQ